MNKIRAAVVGYGNIGRYALEALEAAPDFEVAGIVRRNPQDIPEPLRSYTVTDHLEKLTAVDVAILATPTRLVETYAKAALTLGIRTVDSFDIHTQITDLRRTLDAEAKRHSTVAVVAAGWDPGSDSVVRTLMQAIVPEGITYTDFGPGMSMGHTVAVKAIDGVRSALSMTIPMGTGVHRRMVYVEIADGYDFDTVADAIRRDDYFAHDETHVIRVDSVDELKDVGHGVHLTRKGVSGMTHNQRISFGMQINNPALTGQILVAAARATMRLQPGAYTMIEIPPVDLLPGNDREAWIGKLV